MHYISGAEIKWDMQGLRECSTLCSVRFLLVVLTVMPYFFLLIM